MGLFAKIKKNGTTVVMVTHNKGLSLMTDREVVVLSDGKVRHFVLLKGENVAPVVRVFTC